MRQSNFGAQWRKRFEAYGANGVCDADIAGWSANGLATRFSNFQAIWRGRIPGAIWLDIGCGAGTYTEYLSDRGMRVFGFDYSLPSLCKAKLKYNGPSGWVGADALRLPVRDEAVDGVICFGVAQAVDDIERLVGELVRVTRPGGEVWLDALNARFFLSAISRWSSRVKGEPDRLRYDFTKEIAKALRAHGAEVIRIHRLMILPNRLGSWQDAIGRLMRSAGWLSPFLSIACHAFVVEARRGEKDR